MLLVQQACAAIPCSMAGGCAGGARLRMVQQHASAVVMKPAAGLLAGHLKQPHNVYIAKCIDLFAPNIAHEAHSS